jgi:PAS domain S-box-containing protein
MRQLKTSSMNKLDTKTEEHIRVLEEQVTYLTKERQILLGAMEMAGNLSNFQVSVNKMDDPMLILKTTASRAQTFIRFKATSFYLIDESDSGFYQSCCDPERFSSYLDREVNALIDSNTFSWALKRRKSLIIASLDESEQLVLHPLQTSSRIRGMFVGLLGQDKKDISDVSLILFTIAMASGADALESFELYKQLKNVNRELATNVVKLEESERELIQHRDDLEKLVSVRTVALTKSEAKYRSIFENSIEGIFQATPDGSYISANPALARIYGYDSPEELRNSEESALDQLCADSERRAEFIKVMEEEGGVVSFETQIRRKDGSPSWVSISARAIRSEEEVSLYEGTVVDISDKKSLEAELFQAEKMEAVGRLAGGIAHDFNNILTGIMGYGALLNMKMDVNDPSRNYVEQIIKAAKNAADLTKGLLTLGKRQSIEPKSLNLNSIIKGAKKTLSRFVAGNIRLSVVQADRDIKIMADSTQIEQLLVNLVTNANDAMPSGGKLKISTGTAYLKREYVRTYGYGEPGEYAVLSVEDTGAGMDEKTRESIFEPFFTTKATGQGAGLGLSIVYGIVKQHDGYIDCKSEPGKGTVFTIYFPLIGSKVENVETPAAASPSGRAATILLAEDNPEVKNLLKEVLVNAGYKVIEASDGEDAVSLFKKNRNRIQLLILDMMMPRKNGKEAYDEIKESEPNIEAIMISGYSHDVLRRNGGIAEGLTFFPKPILPDQLLHKVRDVFTKQ